MLVSFRAVEETGEQVLMDEGTRNQAAQLDVVDEIVNVSGRRRDGANHPPTILPEFSRAACPDVGVRKPTLCEEH